MPTNRIKTPQLKQKKLQKTCIEKKKKQTLDLVGQRKKERKKRRKTKKEEG
jgi:hypothetical protein